MNTETDPFETVRTVMLDNVDKMENAIKGYLDLMQKAMLSMPNANESQIATFRAYLDRQLGANQVFVSRLVSAKNLQEAMQIQVEYFQSQMRTTVSDAMQLSESITSASRRAAG